MLTGRPGPDMLPSMKKTQGNNLSFLAIVLGIFLTSVSACAVLSPVAALTALPRVLPEPPPPPEPEEEIFFVEEEGEPPFQTLIAQLKAQEAKKPFFAARGQGPDRHHSDDYEIDAPATLNASTLRWENNWNLRFSPWSWPEN